MKDNKVIIGLDIGGSTTKVVGFQNDKLLLETFVKSSDPVSSAYGGLGKFLTINKLKIDDIETISMTGVGSSYIDNNLLNIKTIQADEFKSVGLGGLYISGLDEAIVVSVGTGTSLIYGSLDSTEHIIGSGVGGGTILGISNKMINYRDFDLISQLAAKGDLSHVDLTVGDISKSVPGLKEHTTASNFGKMSDDAKVEDLAAAIINMVFQSIGTSAVLAARLYKTKDIVFVGSVVHVAQETETLKDFEDLYNVNMVVPEKARFSTAIGAALSSLRANK